jgi:hypothetical protein
VALGCAFRGVYEREEGPMALTRLQRKLRKEAEEIAAMAQVDFWNIEKREPEWRTMAFRIAISRLVIAEVVARYTLLDEVLAEYLCAYYFGRRAKESWGIYWKQKKFRLFVHFMLDEMYLLKKMQMVHAINPLPKEVRETIHKVNAIRNAMAHSFFPENRKEHFGTGQVPYDGKDIRTTEGLRKFKDDYHDAYDYIKKEFLRIWR